MTASGAGIKSIAPILLVDSIEACLDFWTDLGFTMTVSVPEHPPRRFAIFVRDAHEVMLQTRTSATDDLGDIGGFGPSILYITVPDLAGVLPVIDPARIVVPRRTTFYGADEVYVRDPAGNVVGFAAHA